jgi:FtsP/CotA-like multicopper oxidase with cupredoxin domain
MHPFHIHLVSFVVLRRFSFQAVDASNPVDYQFVEQPLAAGYDNNIRHDTVRIYANEMVELLVYFPASPCCGVNYTGRYPYHCHLVEHEDMGMMLHVEVLP